MKGEIDDLQNQVEYVKKNTVSSFLSNMLVNAATASLTQICTLVMY